MLDWLSLLEDMILELVLCWELIRYSVGVYVFRHGFRGAPHYKLENILISSMNNWCEIKTLRFIAETVQS